MSEVIANDVPPRLAVLEEIARGTKAALDRIERRLDTMDSRIERLGAEHRTDTRWLLSLIIGGNVALFGIMAHGFHWL